MRPWRHCLGASLSRRCGRPVGVGFLAALPLASPASSLSRSALCARDALVLEHLRIAGLEGSRRPSRNWLFAAAEGGSGGSHRQDGGEPHPHRPAAAPRQGRPAGAHGPILDAA